MYSKIALSIGGSDSGGGAGIQADLRTFMALKIHGCSVITCITAQNSIEVKCVEAVEKNTLLSQIDTLFSDFGIIFLPFILNCFGSDNKSTSASFISISIA